MAVAKSKADKSTSSKYVDFDEFINYQLKKTRSGIHHTDIISSIVILASFLLGYLLLFTICDHWLIPGGFSDLTRTILFALVSSLSVGWLFIKIAMPLYREVNILYAAREIEETYPELKDSLLSWVQLREEGREIPPDILKALEKRTALEIKKSDVDLAVDRRFLMRSSYVLLGIVVAMCIYTVFSPKNISNSVWRALLPASNVSASTKTVILEVVPGDYEVLAHDQLDVTVDLDGVIPEEVRLLFSTTDKRFVDEPLIMRNTGEGLPRFRTRLSGVNGEGLLKDFTYRIEAGDAVSDTFFVKIKQPPSATVTEIEYDYPDYMLLDDKTQQGSTIDAWEGVYVTVRAKTNMPVVSANLYRSDNDVAEETADVIAMRQVSSQEVEARWRLKFRDDGTFANYYFIQVENSAGEEDPLPTIHRIKIRPDLNPEISILYPTEDLDVPANAVIPIAYEANDPDFMLRRVLLKMERQGELLPTVPRLYEGAEVPRVKGKYQLDLKPLALDAGDVLQFYLEAEDNFEPFDQIPKHVTRTSKITLNIVEPVEQEKAEEFQQEQQEQLKNQIAEDQQQNQNRNGNRQPENQPQREPGNQEQRSERPEEETGEAQPMEEGEPADQGEMKEGSQPNQQNQNTNSSDSGTNQNPENQGDPTGENSESTDTSETQEGTEGPQAADEQEPGEKGSTQKKTGNGDSASEKKDTNQEGSSRSKPGSKAQDDQALEELLKWSKDKPEPKESPEDQAEESTEETPENQNNNAEKYQKNSSESDSQSDNDAAQNKSSNSNPDDSQNENSSAGEMQNKSTESTDPKNADNNDSTTPQNNNEEMPTDNSAPTENGDQNKPSMNESNDLSKTNQSPANEEKGPTENSEDQTNKNMSQAEKNNSSNSGDNKQPSDMSEASSGETKPGETKPGETKPRETKPGETKPGETKPGETKPGETKPGETKPGETKPGETKPGETKPGETKPGETKPGETKPGETKPGETKPGETKPGETKPGETKPGETKPGETKPGETKPGETKPGETKPGETKPGETKPGETKPGETKPGETKPGETKPGETKPGETKPGETKPGETKPGETKPGETKPGETKPGETKPGETKPGETKPGETKPGETKPGETKPGETKPGETKPGETKPGETKPGETKPGETKPGETKPGETKPGETKPGETKPGETKPGETKPGESKQGESKQGESKQGESKPGESKQGESKQGETGAGESGSGEGMDGPGEGAEGEEASDKQGKNPSDKSGPGGPGGTTNKNSEKGTASNEPVPLTPEEANLENKKKAVDLALKKLKDRIERGETPEDLMEELGFSDQDLSSFMQRLEERLADPGINQNPDAEAARRQFNQLLKGIDYNSTGERRDGGSQPRQSASGFGGGQRSVPPEYRMENEAYKRRLSRQGTDK